MDKQLEDILNSLPPRAPRSRLEPYADLIDEMRRRSWTFRDIARVLGEKCNVEVSPSNVHHFVKLRTLKTNRGKRTIVTSRATLSPQTASVSKRNARADAATDVYRRIATIRQHAEKSSASPEGIPLRS
jgi:IS30 family transposase